MGKGIVRPTPKPNVGWKFGEGITGIGIQESSPLRPDKQDTTDRDRRARRADAALSPSGVPPCAKKPMDRCPASSLPSTSRSMRALRMALPRSVNSTHVHRPVPRHDNDNGLTSAAVTSGPARGFRNARRRTGRLPGWYRWWRRAFRGTTRRWSSSAWRDATRQAWQRPRVRHPCAQTHVEQGHQEGSQAAMSGSPNSGSQRSPGPGQHAAKTRS